MDGTVDIQKDIRTWLASMLDACSLCTSMHFTSSVKSFHMLNTECFIEMSYVVYCFMCVLAFLIIMQSR